MNKKGQTMGLAVLSAIIIFIIGLMIVNFIMPEVTNVRAGLSCASASSISDGTKMLCLIIDTVVPYWVLIVFSVITGIITARLVL